VQSALPLVRQSSSTRKSTAGNEGLHRIRSRKPFTNQSGSYVATPLPAEQEQEQESPVIQHKHPYSNRQTPNRTFSFDAISEKDEGGTTARTKDSARSLEGSGKQVAHSEIIEKGSKPPLEPNATDGEELPAQQDSAIAQLPSSDDPQSAQLPGSPQSMGSSEQEKAIRVPKPIKSRVSLVEVSDGDDSDSSGASPSEQQPVSSATFRKTS